MKMNELEGKTVKIGKTSITIKDENGKTRGVVRNVRTFSQLNNNQTCELWHLLRASGLWGNKADVSLDCLVMDGRELYFLNDLKALEMYDKYFSSVEMWPEENKRKKERLAIAEYFRQNHACIDCYIA